MIDTQSVNEKRSGGPFLCYCLYISALTSTGRGKRHREGDAKEGISLW